jgi:hypothetical protein
MKKEPYDITTLQELPCWILVTGLVRDLEQLKNKLDIFKFWKESKLIHGVVFSTWIGEIDKYPGLRKELEQQEVIIVESPIPSGGERFFGWALEQFRALEAGLVQCPKKAFIMRARWDKLYLDKDSIWPLKYPERFEVDPPINWPNPFRARIYVRYGYMRRPFLLRDHMILASAEDFSFIVDCFKEREEHAYLCTGEMQYFCNPWTKYYPILHEFMLIDPISPAWGHPNREIMQANSLNSNFYCKVLMYYYLILRHYFFVAEAEVDSSPVKESDFLNCMSQMTWTQWFSVSSKKPSFLYHKGIVDLYFTSDLWLKFFINSKLKLDHLGERLIPIIDSIYREAGNISNYYREQISTEAKLYQKFARDSLKD